MKADIQSVFSGGSINSYESHDIHPNVHIELVSDNQSISLET